VTWRAGGIAARIGLAALIVAGLAIAILAIGVVVVGGQSFADLMAGHGESAESSRAMFADSVGWVVIATSIVAVLVAVGVAGVLGAMLARPLRDKLGDDAERPRYVATVRGVGYRAAPVANGGEDTPR